MNLYIMSCLIYNVYCKVPEKHSTQMTKWAFHPFKVFLVVSFRASFLNLLVKWKSRIWREWWVWQDLQSSLTSTLRCYQEIKMNIHRSWHRMSLWYMYYFLSFFFKYYISMHLFCPSAPEVVGQYHHTRTRRTFCVIVILLAIKDPLFCF